MNRAAVEHPRHSGLTLTVEMQDFLRRRTRPFLDRSGVELPLPHLLEEAYLQGLRDATQALAAKEG